jgi:hypothetical protein
VLGTPRFYVLEGDIATAVDLVPTAYRAQVKDSSEQQDRGKDLPAMAIEIVREASEPQSV